MKSRYTKTFIEGVFEINNESFIDQRGTFINSYRYQENAYFQTWSDREIKQINISFRNHIGTICGLHIQNSRKGEAKLIRCLQGKIWDVAIDLRKNSSTFGKWHSIELSPEKGNAIFIPEGCAHGFQVIEENSQLLYIHSEEWIQNQETGIRWDDPTLNIKWPMSPTFISEKDLSLPFLKDF